MARILRFFGALPGRWEAWAAVILICAGLLGGALYFQIHERDYPCELCIYTRVWISAIALVAVAGLALRNTVWPVRVVVAIELALSIGLAMVVYDLLGLEYGFGAIGACSIYPTFPTWAPLDQWLPVLYQVQGPCAATPEVLLGLSMADGLTVVAVAFIVSFALALVGHIATARRTVP
jgi:disulfide bond formation protein DsbB